MNICASPPPATGPSVVRWQPRRIPLSRSRNLCGELPIVLEGFSVPYESKLERAAIAFLVSTPGLRFLQSQPFTVSSPTNPARRYTPDLLAVYSPLAKALERLGFEMWTVIEVKPLDRLLAHPEAINTRLRWVAQATGMAAVCLTEREIDGACP